MTSTHTNNTGEGQSRTDSLLTLDGVGIWFDTTPVTELCRDLDIAIRSGDFHCLTGRSGSGKTSILRVAAGLAEPRAGSVRWQGRAVATMSPDERARQRRELMGYADQSTVVVPGFTTWENTVLPAVPGRRTRAFADRAVELLEMVGLADRLHLPADSLSGGERQRAVLARALLLQPRVLVLDEPTASLDRVTADRLIDELSRYADQGGAILCASHDPHVIRQARTVTELD